MTLNEPNGLVIANRMVPQGAKDILEATLRAARKSTGSPDFVGGPAFQYAPSAQPQLLKAHRLGFEAIKSAQPGLPVGFSLAFVD